VRGGQRTDLTPMGERVELLRQAELLRAGIPSSPSTRVTCARPSGRAADGACTLTAPPALVLSRRSR
jgi:hypothetical protein